MKLLHSSIQLSQKVLHAIPLNSTDPNIINALLIFRNYVQKIKIDCSESTPSIFSVAIYPLGAPICHVLQFGQSIAAVTSDAYIIFFSPDQPYNILMKYQLTDRISPSQIPVAHVLPSINHNFIVCCGFSKNCVVVDNNFAENRIELPNFIVLGIAQGASDNIFAFLIMKPNDERSVIFIDITSKQYNQIDEVSVPKDTYKIITSNDGILAFTKTAINLLGTEKTIPSSQISTYFFATPKYLIYQTIDGNMFGLNTSNFKLSQLGTIPLTSIFYLFSPTLLLCVSEYSNCYFISLPKIDDQIDIQFQFNELPKQVLHFTPRAIAATFNGRSLIVASGHNDESSITQILNTIQHNRQFLVKINLADQNTDKLRLFWSLNESIILSSTTKTTVIYSQVFNYSENPTIEIGHLKAKSIQIHKRGINVIQSTIDEELIKWESPDEVLCGSIGEESCFVSLKTENRGIVLDSEFNVISDKPIGTVYSATYCGKSIAIAIKSDGSNHSAISIYSPDLNPGDSEIHLQSQVVSMRFNQATMELFVSTQDGFVYKISIIENTDNIDLEETVVTIYSGKVAPLIFNFCDAILIVAEKTFVYNGQQLLPLSPTTNTIEPAAVTTCENNVFVLEKNGNLQVVTVEEMENDLTTNVLQPLSTPRRMANCGDLTLTVSRSKIQDKVKSVISILQRSKEKNETFCIRNFPFRLNNQIADVAGDADNVGIISLLVVPGRSQIILGCYTTKKASAMADSMLPSSLVNQRQNNEKIINEYFLNVLEFNPDNEDSFVSVQKIPLSDSPNVISFINGLVLLGTGRHIYPMISNGTEWKIQNSALASIHTQVGFIDVFENFVWIGDKTQSVICFAFKSSDKNEPKLVPVAIDTQPKQLTAMRVIDKYTIIVADKFGIITILRLPDDVIAGSSWRLSHPAERGVFMPPSGHLISLASFNVGETVTSLIKSDFSPSLFYTTLLGQIGALIPISNEEDYTSLQTAENLIKQHWQNEFAMMKLKKFDHSMISVIDLDFIEQLDQLSDEAQTQIENALKANNKTIQQIMGIFGKYKALCKF